MCIRDSNSSTRDLFLAVLSSDNLTTGLDFQENLQEEVVLFPNPTNSTFTIKSTRPIQQIEVFNSSGQIVSTKPIKGNYYLTWTIESNGIFFVKITTDEQIIAQKIVVNKSNP